MSGCVAVIRRVASNPSIPRMRTSISTTSGRRLSAIVTAASPLAHSPITEISRSRARIIFTPSRIGRVIVDDHAAHLSAGSLSMSFGFMSGAHVGRHLVVASRETDGKSLAYNREYVKRAADGVDVARRRPAPCSRQARGRPDHRQPGCARGGRALGLDAAAAVLTLYAVGVAERPPDAAHQYGHGKAQHLAALFEALLLSAAALWIATEAVSRLRSGSHDVDPTWYAFALMGGVLVVDAARTTVSLREGRRGRNAALIANAYHFGSDFAGTVAVLIGLVLVSAGVDGGDAWAALFVAVLVLVAAVRLGVGNVHVLMDRAPIGLAGEIERAVRGVQGVREVRAVRVREAGGESFADVTIGVSRLEGLERSHETMDRVEQAVRDRVGPAQVTVHVEPTASRERPTERVAAAALRVPGVVETHNINVLEGPDGRAVTLHARLGANFTMAQVAPVLARLKREIGQEFGVARVYIHVEPFHPEAQPARDVSADEPGADGPGSRGGALGDRRRSRGGGLPPGRSPAGRDLGAR